VHADDHYNYQIVIYIYTSIYYSDVLLFHYAPDDLYLRITSRSLFSFTTVYREMRAKLLPPILVYLHMLMTTSAFEGANLAGYVKTSREDRVFCRWPRSRFFFRGIRTIKFEFSWWRSTTMLLYVISLN